MEYICELDSTLFPERGGTALFRHIEKPFPSLFFVAETTEKDIIGYILGGIHLEDAATGKLIRIGVVPKYQRMECWTLLTGTLFAEMKRRGVANVHLTVAETNTPAITFDHKIRFFQSDRIARYFYPETPRLVLWKEL